MVAELFATRPWALEDLLNRYAKDFAFWRTDVQNRPLQLSATWWVEQALSHEFEIGDEPWEIRVAEICAPGPVAPVSYVPVVASWKRQASAPEEGILIEDGPPVYQVAGRFSSKQEAEKITGPLRKVGAGEGFSAYEAAQHFLVIDSGTMLDFPPDEIDGFAAEKVSVLSFASASERRAYLRERNLVAAELPETFAISAGGGFGPGWAATWDGTTLEFDSYDPQSADHREARIAPTLNSWKLLWNAMDRIGVWDWRMHYQPEDMVTDGYGWEVVLTRAGRSVAANGYVAVPTRTGSAEDNSVEWAELVQAVRQLTGQPIELR